MTNDLDVDRRPLWKLSAVVVMSWVVVATFIWAMN